MKKINKHFLEAYKKLSNSEQETLRLCSILLSVDDESVHISHLCEACSDTSPIEGNVMTIIKAGLLTFTFFDVSCPKEVKSSLNYIQLRANTINKSLAIIRKNITNSFNLKESLDYYRMASNLIGYIIRHKGTDEIDYELLTEVVLELARNHEIVAKGEPLRKCEDIMSLRALSFCKKKINKNSLLYAAILTNISRFYIEGFRYNKALRNLKSALEIESNRGGGVELSETYLVLSSFFITYGNIPEGMKYLYLAYTCAKDEFVKALASIGICYRLALADVWAECDRWLSGINFDILTPYNKICIMRSMIEALRYKKSSVDKSNKWLDKAEMTLLDINNEAPFLSEIKCLRSDIYEDYGLPRLGNEYYLSYALDNKYCPTEGALLIYFATECIRFCQMNAITSAKYIVNNILDLFDLTSCRYSLSVKEASCIAYAMYLRSSNLAERADNYTNLLRKCVQDNAPSKDCLSIIQKIFANGRIPESFSGESQEWVCDMETLRNLLANNHVINLDIKKHIDYMKARYTNHELELTVIESSLLDAYSAIKAYHKCLTMASKAQRFTIALLCARYAAATPLAFDSAEFYKLALDTEEFQHLNKYLKTGIIIEAAKAIELSGLKTSANEYWKEAYELAKDTPMQVDVFQANANVAYEHGSYSEALNCINMALKAYQPESRYLIDERLCSMLLTKANCHFYLGNIQAAYDATKEAAKWMPCDVFEAFNVVYSWAFYSIISGRYQEGRRILKNAQRLAREDEEKDNVKSLFGILNLPIKQREEYIKSMYINQ